MNKLPFIITDTSITVFVNNKPFTVGKDTSEYAPLRIALLAGQWDAIPAIVDKIEGFKQYTKGYFEIRDEMVWWNDTPIHGVLVDKIFLMWKEGFDVEPMVNFYSNLRQNPSKTAVDELYLFLESGSMPITEDGCFLAYKRVRKNYTDCHSGKISNRIGDKPTMERNEVDDNRNNLCSYGFHFCSFKYLGNFTGERIMVVKINPKDVVSIPADYGNTKGRTCRYEVVDEITDEYFKDTDNDILSKTIVATNNEDEEEEVEEQDYEEAVYENAYGNVYEDEEEQDVVCTFSVGDKVKTMQAGKRGVIEDTLMVVGVNRKWRHYDAVVCADSRGHNHLYLEKNLYKV